MSTFDPFHEAKIAIGTVERELTAVSTINIHVANIANQACESAVRGLYKSATGNDFPYHDFQPCHVVESVVTKLGVKAFYSPESQRFMGRLTGWAPQEARYESTQAYKNHTKPSTSNRGQELLSGVTKFVGETESLAKRSDVVSTVQSNAKPTS
jgi:hypothetical protein